MHPWKSFPVRVIEARLLSGILCIRTNVNRSGICGSSDALCKHEFLFHPLCRLNKTFSSQSSCFAISRGCSHRLRKHTSSLQKLMSHSDKIRRHASVVFVRLVAAMLLVTSVSIAASNTLSCMFDFMKSSLMCCNIWGVFLSHFHTNSFYIVQGPSLKRISSS